MHHHLPFRHVFAIAGVSLLLQACGGGGGGSTPDTASFSASYPVSSLQLFASTNITPTLTGFGSRTASCTVIGGALPAGLALQGNCSVTGRPTQAGSFPVTVRVGASGVTNTVDVSASVVVAGPSLVYTDHTAAGAAAVTVGNSIGDTPTMAGWTQPTDVTGTWSYAVATGSLPTGLSLNASTGAIAGVVAAAGSSTAGIRGTFTTSFGSYQTAAAGYSVNVNLPNLGYTNTGGSGNTPAGNFAVYWGTPFQATAQLTPTAPGSTLGNFRVATGSSLPNGLTLDASTGLISGTSIDTVSTLPITPVQIQADLTTGSTVSTVAGTAALQVVDPISVTYPTAQIQVLLNIAMTPVSPTITVVDPRPFTVTGYNFVPSSGACVLPTGLSVNAATGTLSGTPTTGGGGAFLCNVDLDVSFNSLVRRLNPRFVTQVN